LNSLLSKFMGIPINWFISDPLVFSVNNRIRWRRLWPSLLRQSNNKYS
jgi:hypothetical protein